MPRGDNPNSRKNLLRKEDLTAEQRRESASRAGKASAKARKEYASLTEAARSIIGSKEKEELINMLHKRAKMGNLKAFELLRDQLGDKPVEKSKSLR